MRSLPRAPYDDLWRLECALCRAQYEPEYAARCANCGGPVLADPVEVDGFSIDDSATGIWQYRQMLRLPSEHRGVSLGEAMTPLVDAEQITQRHGLGRVSLKLDHLCPTGSFKDRAVAAGVSHAAAHGRPGLICASSGNAATAAAAYGARAGLPVVLVVPEETPQEKMAANGAYGARQIMVRGDYSESFAVAERLAEHLTFANVTTTYMNPFSVSALRSVAYDLFRQSVETPNVVVVPTSAGPLVHGIARGFDDLLTWGLIQEVPRIVAAQPQGCAPVVRAWEMGAEEVDAWGDVHTTVSGLGDPLRGYAGDGTVTLRALRSTKGAGITVSDKTAHRERKWLAEHEGVHAEPAGALGVAALGRMFEAGVIDGDDTVVCLVTGNGLKQPLSSPSDPLVIDDGDIAYAAAKLEQELDI